MRIRPHAIMSLLILIQSTVVRAQWPEADETMLEDVLFSSDQVPESPGHVDQWDINMHEADDLTIGTPGISVLSQLPDISVFLASRIHSHLSRNGFPHSPLEMEAMDFLNEQEKIRLYRELNPISLPGWTRNSSRREHIFGKVWWRFGRRTPLDNAYSRSPRTHPGSAMLGSPNYWLLRVKGKSTGGISFGFTGEKDAGEPWQGYSPDHTSAYLAYQGEGLIERLIIGDYLLEVGQGLCLWTGGQLFRASSTDLSRYSRGIHPYSGSMEMSGMRGLAMRLRLGKWRSESFFSNRNISGRFDEKGHATLQIDGLHQTLTDQDRRKSLLLREWGHNLRYSSKNLRIGLAISKHVLSSKYGQSFNVLHIGLNGRHILKTGQLYWEMASNEGLRPSIILGGTFRIQPQLRIGSEILWQHPEIFSPLSTVRHEAHRSGMNNIQFSAAWTPNSSLSIRWDNRLNRSAQSGSIHHQDRNIHGQRFIVQYSLAPRNTLLLQYNGRFSKDKGTRPMETISSTAQNQSQQYRLEWIHHLTASGIRLRHRLEVAHDPLQPDTEEQLGHLFFQDWLFSNETWQVGLRWTAFSIPSYALRLYAFLPDVTQRFNIPVYFGEGIEWNLKCRYTIASWKVEARITHRMKTGDEENQTAQVRTDMGLQLIYAF